MPMEDSEAEIPSPITPKPALGLDPREEPRAARRGRPPRQVDGVPPEDLVEFASRLPAHRQRHAAPHPGVGGCQQEHQRAVSSWA